MNRRRFTAGAVAFVAAPLSTEAQQADKVVTIGLVAYGAPLADVVGVEPRNPPVRAFIRALRDLGYVERRNLVLERRSAEGRADVVPTLLRDLARRNVDVIVTSGNTVARSAKELAFGMPIVMVATTSPVETGLVHSLAKPGGNFTALSIDAGPEIIGKRVELLKQVLPALSRVAFVGPRRAWAREAAAAQLTARQLGVELLLAAVEATDFQDAFATISMQRAQAILVGDTAANFVHRQVLIEFAARSRLPAIHAYREAVLDGALASYGADVSAVFARAAVYVHKILSGAKANDLPVEQPTKFELLINMNAARALGLTIPPSLLLSADEIIE